MKVMDCLERSLNLIVY